MSVRKGRLVAEILSGSWRDSPDPVVDWSVAQLDEVTPLLYASGVPALAWRRVRHSTLETTASGELLHQAYRLLALQSEIQEQKLRRVAKVFRTAGVEPILAKGWLAAGLYPERALRPFGDFDLCVRPEELQTFQQAWDTADLYDCMIDLHKGFVELKGRSFAELFSRSQLVTVQDQQIRALGAEDHLALLCLHFLKHGAWRPLWLCDVATAVESLPATFDWEICLGRISRQRQWIAAAIGAAHQLLGARIDHLPAEIQRQPVPDWLTQSILQQWSALADGFHLPMHSLPLMSAHLKQGRGLMRAVLNRWPDPITATFNLNGRFNNFPRVPYQLADFIVVTTRYLVHLPAKLRSQN